MAYLEEILKEAREKGLKIKQSKWFDGVAIDHHAKNWKILQLDGLEIFSDDWELVEEKRELSARDIREAIEHVHIYPLSDRQLGEIIYRLGFKDE